MKTLLILIATIAAAASAGGAAAVPAFADTSTSISIVGHQVLGTPGTYTLTSSGSLSDSGTFDETFELFAAIPSPVTGIAQIELTFTGKAGTLTMECQDRFGAPTGSLAVLNGNCVVIGGTGAYAGLHGTAQVVAVFDPTFTSLELTVQGQVH